jgi:hypothetical protein
VTTGPPPPPPPPPPAILEPGTLILFGIGLLGVLVFRRKMRSKRS